MHSCQSTKVRDPGGKTDMVFVASIEAFTTPFLEVELYLDQIIRRCWHRSSSSWLLWVRNLSREHSFVFCLHSFFCCTLLTSMPSLAVVFYVLVIPYTVSHMSWAYLFVSVVLTVSVLYALGRTAMRDPGFYPRSPPHSEVELGYVFFFFYHHHFIYILAHHST